ncbi:helix-turn-helix transcriptional regulator [Paenibacillus sp. 481]|uniref:helix-turn-helix transcriptional regulator n=1 Tax=Paenibacillus sp. 481 TaxID=2835869 RepID=UPI001E3C783D|nr:AraC family transcriptional regulator [Paenibacillus sp. 481]UHA73711.1 helix-turn-helix transcriptional regulator [Paenibacillus sp. 481]
MKATDFHQLYDQFFDHFHIERRPANELSYSNQQNQQNQTNQATQANSITQTKDPVHPFAAMTIPSFMGQGTIRRMVPRSDLEIVISNYTLHKVKQFNIHADTPMIELNFCLQGMRNVRACETTYTFQANRCALQFMGSFDAQLEFDNSEPIVTLGIGIPVTTFQHFMAYTNGRQSDAVSKLLAQRSFHLLEQPIDPTASVIVEQLMNPPAGDSTRNIYMECKALELLSHCFDTFILDRPPMNDSQRSLLSRTDLEKIKEAQVILLHRMANPPSLLELAKMVGINDFKLKIGFKEVYGHTVFGYLRDKRLEKAWLLLQQGQMNVMQAAVRVGYSNPSHFAQLFREKYGVNPSQLIRGFT